MLNLRRLGLLLSITPCFCFVSHSTSLRSQNYIIHHDYNWVRVSSLKKGNTSTKINLLWFGGGDDKTKDNADSQKQSTASPKGQQPKSNSKMGTTATTMENFKQSQELGKKTSALLNDLKNTIVEGTAAKGKIKVTVDGQQRPRMVEIDEEYFAGVAVEDLAEKITLAMQDAHDKSTKVMEDRMGGLYAELGLPTNKQ